MATFTESVEALKREYTDKYVVVDPRRPELARFEHYVGQIKTVNMSGRALVEFLDYHLNIGWFDIDLSALKVVDKPTEESKAEAQTKRAAAAPAAKPAAADAGGKKLSPLEMARQQGAQKPAGAAPAAKPAGGAKASVADILAAARGGSAAKPAGAAPPATPAAAKPASGAKPSVADILAAARAGAKPAEAAAPAEAAPPAPAKAAAPKPAAAPAPAAGGIVRVDKSGMSVDEMIAYCREHDAGRAG